MKMNMKNRSHRFVINRTRPRNGQKYGNFQMSQYDDAYMY